MDKTKVIEAATKYVQKGQLDKAIKEYQRLVDADPKDIRGWQKLAELFQKKGDNHEAAQTFLRVAESYSEQGFFLKAVAVYKQILKIDAELIDVNVRLAELYKQLGLVGEAMSQFQVVASYYEKIGNAREGLATLKKIVELDPENSAALRRLAEMYAREGMNAEAATAFQRSAEQLKKAGRTDDFVKVAERLLTITPNDMTLTRDLAKVYLEKQDTKRALAKLQVCFKANARDVETLQLLGQAFEALGQTGKTISVFKELAKIYAEQKKNADAEKMWRRVIDLAADDVEAQQALGISSQAPAPQAERSRPHPVVVAPPPPSASAGAAAPRAMPSRHPGDKPPPEQIARLLTETEVYLKYGLHEKALEHLRKIYSVDPENVGAHEKARDIYLRQNNISAASEEVAMLVPLHLARGELERARHNVESLKVMSPSHPALAELEARLAAPRGSDEDVPEAASIENVDEPLELSPEAEELIAEAEEVAPRNAAKAVPPPPPDEEEMEVIEDEAIIEDEEAMLADAEAAGAVAATIAAEAEIEEEVIAEVADDGVVEVVTNRAKSAAADMGKLAENAFDVGEELVDEDEDISIAAGEDEPVAVLETGPVALVEDEGDDELAAAAAVHAEDDVIDETADAEVAPTFKPVPHAPRPPLAPPAPALVAEDPDDEYAEEIAEADFFIQEGMAEDAREILEGILLAEPDHPRANARLRQMDAPAEAAPAPVDQSFDLARELAEEIGAGEAPATDAMDDFQYSVEDVFAEFKKGVERTIALEDADTHYDLGIAYKEMGLLDDAVGEFEQALKGKGKKSKADYLLVMGLCLAEKGDAQAAVQRFTEALAIPDVSADVAKGLHFELATSYEALGDDAQAVAHFATVMRGDSGYRNVKEALERVARKAESGGGTPPKDEASAPRKIGYV